VLRVEIHLASVMRDSTVRVGELAIIEYRLSVPPSVTECTK
jgi:hypothetical protein